MRTKYKIIVKAIQGHILTYSTDSYEVIDGFVTWTDSRTDEIKRFHSSNCEIKEVRV